MEGNCETCPLIEMKVICIQRDSESHRAANSLPGANPLGEKISYVFRGVIHSRYSTIVW